MKNAEDATIAKHRLGHEQRGQTIAVYFPPEAPWKQVEAISDAIAELVHGADRQGWDAFMWGQGGECDLTPSPLSPGR